MATSWIYSLVILPFMFEVSSSRRLSIGPEAQRLCRTYRKVCSSGRFCAMQYFHTPRNISLPICVPEHIIPAERKICDLQPDEGKCGARYIRWFYHKGYNKCNWFYFGGCDGNQNNFRTKHQCEDNCRAAIDNNAHTNQNKAIALPVKTSPVVISEPIFLPERTNQITRSFSLRSKKVGKHDKERRRKRRLRDRKKRRLQKLRRRRRKLNITPRKRRRDGKISGRKRKNRKKRRQGRKNKKKNKNRKNKIHKDKKDKTNVETEQDNERDNDNQRTNEKRKEDKQTTEIDTESQSPLKTLTVLDSGDEETTDDRES
ncbi:chromatin assembly factor 1 subunit A-A-like [Mizuhopecten yessoensis]|uniref:Protease inhibitor textilinin-2 n=1 Tax=Mizuhopecten yessoensis TaxID=6573 RepID=A0A210QU17_MIZYE|nr:chromatin assembly factor 1 subunit A-A-like [Mizuhopecten yessoensis]OWF52225.1 Protease inhibitor textilinin-2 [Mizuhopecten yessoensis]